MSSSIHLLLLVLSWLAYGLVHSLLATDKSKLLFKKYFPGYFNTYRLGYNLLAGILLVPPAWLLFSYSGAPLWQWPGIIGWLADAAAVLAIATFIASSGMYDTREFLGLSQLRESQSTIDDRAPMSISTLHRFIRHPWYFLGLVILWTREMNAALLVSAITLTVYVIAGAWLEERKLLKQYGHQYARYRKNVPGLVPLPWKYLSKEEARRILELEQRI